MSQRKKVTRTKEDLWNVFASRVADMVQKGSAKLAQIRVKYSREQDKKKKQVLRTNLAREAMEIAVVAFYEVLATTYKMRYRTEMRKSAEEASNFMTLEEAMTYDQIEQQFLASIIRYFIENQLRKHNDLFEDPELLLKLMVLGYARLLGDLISLLEEMRLFFVVRKIGKDRLGIDENWAIATISLDMEESLIKKKLEELGVPKTEMNRNFKDLLRFAIEVIETKEERRLPSDIYVSGGYRTPRNKLVHEGHHWKPTATEAYDIVAHLAKLANALWVRQIEG